VLVFKERGKLEKNLSEQGREPTTNSTHIWRRRQDSNPGHIGGRRVLSPLRHPCSIYEHLTNRIGQAILVYKINYAGMNSFFQLNSTIFSSHKEYYRSFIFAYNVLIY